jgi:hypothetical protein
MRIGVELSAPAAGVDHQPGGQPIGIPNAAFNHSLSMTTVANRPLVMDYSLRGSYIPEKH